MLLTHLSPAFDFFVEEIIQTQKVFPLSIVVFEDIITYRVIVEEIKIILPNTTITFTIWSIKKKGNSTTMQSLFDLKHWLNTNRAYYH